MPYIKADKLGRIVQIIPSSEREELNGEAVRDTLNFFRGRQLASNLKDCLGYLRIATKAAEGSQEARKRINELHYQWNNCNENEEA